MRKSLRKLECLFSASFFFFFFFSLFDSSNFLCTKTEERRGREKRMELYYVETNGDKSMTRKRVSVSRYFVIKLLMCEKVSVFFFIIINICNTAIH